MRAMISAHGMDLLARRSARIMQEENDRRRSFPAAAVNRLTNDWRTQGISIDSILQQDLPTLRSRSRDLQEGNEYFQRYLWMLKCNVLGQWGMPLKNRAVDLPTFKDGKIIPGKPDMLANQLIQDHWWEWGKKENCTISKNMTFQQVEELSLETWGTDGETLWRMVIGSAAKNRYGFALQAIETDRIDTLKTCVLPNGNKVRMGVEKNADGEKVAFWLLDADPTDSYFGRGYTSKRYDANEFVHPHLLRRIGQSRGWPLAAAALLRLKMLAGYDEATTVGARAAAARMAFLKKTPDAGGVGYTGQSAETGGKYMDAEPGTIEELPAGMEVQVVDWNQPNGQYEPFVKACLRGIAAGFNVSYPTLANDYGEVNFSSGRMSQLEERELWKKLQGWFASEFHTPIFSKWLEVSLLSGAIDMQLASGNTISLPASKLKKFNQPSWQGRRWSWVDPEKEIKAKVAEIRACLTSPTRAILELGEDEDELLDEIEAFRKKAEARGLTFPDLFDEHKQPETPAAPGALPSPDDSAETETAEK